MTNLLWSEESAKLVKTTEICSHSLVRRLCAMLDVDAAAIIAGGLLPRGWHFPLLAGETRRSDLRSDGFPGFGVPMPNLGLPRLLLLGRTVEFVQDLPIGASVTRTSTLEELRQKESPSGPSAIVTLRHEISIEGAVQPALIETQSYLLRREAPKLQAAQTHDAATIALSKIIIPDEIMLFQYSALGFNSHKIHLDRSYAQDVEGLQDLVVNGGLITLLLTEYLRTELAEKPLRIRTKHVAPLFCNRPAKLTGMRVEQIIRLFALDNNGVLATEIEADIL